MRSASRSPTWRLTGLLPQARPGPPAGAGRAAARRGRPPAGSGSCGTPTRRSTPSTRIHPGHRRPADGLAFLCADPAEVDASTPSWSRPGPAVMEPWDAAWGQRYAVLHDPDGNGVDLSPGLKQLTRHPAARRPAPSRPARGAPGRRTRRSADTSANGPAGRARPTARCSRRIRTSVFGPYPNAAGCAVAGGARSARSRRRSRRPADRPAPAGHLDHRRVRRLPARAAPPLERGDGGLGDPAHHRRPATDRPAAPAGRSARRPARRSPPARCRRRSAAPSTGCPARLRGDLRGGVRPGHEDRPSFQIRSMQPSGRMR